MLRRNDTPTRILIVDDNREFIRALMCLLNADARFHVVGYALSGRGGLSLATELAPDVALIDFDMPGMSGFETIGCLREAGQKMRTVILSGHEEREYAYRAVLAGADAFVAKHRVTEDLLPLLEQLATSGFK